MEDEIREGIAKITLEADYRDAFNSEYVTEADRDIHRKLADRILFYLREQGYCEVEKILLTIGEDVIEPILGFYVTETERPLVLKLWSHAKIASRRG